MHGPAFLEHASDDLACLSQANGLVISATCTNPKTMLSLATVYTLTTMLIAGFYVTNVPSWIE